MERKKWLLPVLMVLMVCATTEANAQFRFGFKGGYNLSTVKFNKEALNTDNIDGFHVGPMIEFMPESGLGLDLAILYSRKGFYSNNDTYTNDYLEVPVNLKVKIGLPVVAPYFAAGPYVSFRVAGDKVKDIMNVNNVRNQIEAKSFGAGLNFTAGAEVLSRIQVGLTYDWGLTDNYQTFNAANPKEYVGKTQTWLISATLLF